MLSDHPHMIWKTHDPPECTDLVQTYTRYDVLKQLSTMTYNCIKVHFFTQLSTLPLNLQKNDRSGRRKDSSPPPTNSALRHRRSSPDPKRRWPPPAQPAPSAPPLPAAFPSLFKAEAQASKSNVVQMEPQEARTEYVHVDDLTAQDSSPTKEKGLLGLARLQFRRSKPA